MGLPVLSPTEARIIGCLMEKSVVTPDQYPLTLNALTNACNQKSSRDPVMSLTQGEVQRSARELKERHLLRLEENFRSGVEKYTQIFCNTNLGDMQLDSAQFAIITLLLLRGPQTPGELRTRGARLHSFNDNSEVVTSLNQLLERERHPLVVKLPRTPGRKDSEYMHLLSGEIDIKVPGAASTEPSTATVSGPTTSVSTSSSQPEPSGAAGAANVAHQRMAALEKRVADLESEVEILKAALSPP